MSMAKFTSQEVKSLQEGGNQVCMHASYQLDISLIFSCPLIIFSFSHIVFVSVSRLQRAKELYLKELDPQRNSFPDSRLTLNFILLYIDRSK